jgi:hypothetical protein
LVLVGLSAFVVLAATLAIVSRLKTGSEFQFLTRLQPKMLSFDGSKVNAAPSSFFGGTWNIKPGQHEIMAFPASKEPHLLALIGKQFATISPLSMSVVATGHVLGGPSVTETVWTESDWSDHSGTQICFVSGPQAGARAGLLTSDPVPSGCCFVITTRPTLWIEWQVGSIKKLLHLP